MATLSLAPYTPASTPCSIAFGNALWRRLFATRLTGSWLLGAHRTPAQAGVHSGSWKRLPPLLLSGTLFGLPFAWPRWRRWSMAVGVPGAYTATPLPILLPGPRCKLPPPFDSGATSWTWPTPSALFHPPSRTSGTNLSLQLNKGAWLSSLPPYIRSSHMISWS